MSHKNKPIRKCIQKGRFYHIHEGSRTGHPGMVYWKNDNKNLYLVITTDSKNGTHRTQLTYPIDSTVSLSFVQNRPMLAKSKNIGGQHSGMKFNKNDKPLLKLVSRKAFRETPDIRRKDRRYMKKLKKKPTY